MKRFLGLWIVIALLLAALVVLPATAEESYVLPADLTEIDDEAFAGNTALTTVVIPQSVQRIGARAFADCSGLQEVYFGKNASIDIARDAFSDCDSISFYVYPDTPAELYALSHGYEYGLMEAGSSFLEKAISIVAATGGTESILQSADFTSRRLIVRTSGNHLPDISAYNPVEIARDGEDTFFIQFENVGDTIGCYYQLLDDSNVVFADSDANLELLDDVTGSGTVSRDNWGTDDPMGFEAYASYVAQKGTGSVTIAVIDSGVSVRSAYSSNLLEGVNMVPDGQKWSYDPGNHGSVIASIIKDCVGNANVRILPIRVVGSNGIGSLTLIGAGIKAAIERGADIINLSMNFEPNAYVTQWINTALSRGITVVVAAGNSSRDIRKVYPANLDGVVAVSGIDSNYELSASSNYGSNIAYCAPDVYITPSAFSGSYTGTSFAAPMIASAMALVKLDPYHRVSDMRDACRDLGTEGRDSAYGYGLPQLEEIAKVYVDSISLDDDIPAQMAVGESYDLTWSIAPEYATDKTVSLESSDDSILSITSDEAGNVRVVAAGQGNAMISVSANNVRNGSHVSSSAEISVVQPVTTISIFGTQPKLAMNQVLHLSAELSPADATSKQFTWMTTNPGVAEISDEGVLTPVSEGTVGVYAVSNDGYGAKSEIASIEVVAVPDAEEIILTERTGIDVSSGSIQLVPGAQLHLAAQVLPEGAEQAVVWSSNSTPEGAITVGANGVVHAVSAGNAEITAIAVNGIKANLKVESVILPISIEVHGDTVIDVGSTSALSLSFTPEDTTDTSVVWTSTQPYVASVDQNGNVRGIRAGMTTIIAQSTRNSVPGSVKLIVRQPYRLAFDANGGNVSTASKTAYSNYAVGELPTPTRDYYNFEGWFTQASGGSRVTANTVLTSDSTITIYAHWKEKPLSDWVLESQVPEGAMIVNRAPADYKESTASSLEGYVRNGDPYWKKVGDNYSKLYSPDRSQVAGLWAYNQMEDSPYNSYESGGKKREVSNDWAGFVYWHWSYNVQYASVTNRSISPVNRTYQVGGAWWPFKYGYALMSPVDCPYLDNYYCQNNRMPSYNCKSVIDSQIPWDNADRLSPTSGLQSNRFFRINYWKSTATDYEWTYRYVRKAVQYRLK